MHVQDREYRKMDFSIVCPIKDEVDLLPITLPSFYFLDPSEVILCLDKPAPLHLYKMIMKIIRFLDVEGITKILEVEDNLEYNFQQAFVRRSGFVASSNDLILTTDIDLILDPEIRRCLGLINSVVGLVSFNRIGYPPTISSVMANLIYKVFDKIGLNHIFRYLLSGKLRIVMYHGIIDDNDDIECWWLIRQSSFVRQIKYIKKNFNVISMNKAYSYVSSNQALPRNACVLSFDDGYKSYLTKALPI